jgi:hypothetical protein
MHRQEQQEQQHNNEMNQVHATTAVENQRLSL